MPFLNTRDASLHVVVQPREQYIIIPSTFDPKQNSRFWLTVYSENPITIGPVMENFEATVNGEWRGPTAGGCYNNNSWINNPKYLLSSSSPPSRDVQVTMTIQQPERSPLAYLGIYSAKWEGHQKLDKRAVHKNSKPCMNRREVAVELTIPPSDWPYVIMPHTFEQGIEMSFELTAHCKSQLKLETLQ